MECLILLCDRDPAFTSAFWRELFQLNGTSFNFSSNYHPQVDGQSEVVNQTIKMYLRCLMSSQPENWAKWLSWAEFCYNTSWHATIGRTQFEVVYGRPPPLLIYVPRTAKVAAVEQELMERDAIIKEIQEKIREAQVRMKRTYDSKHKEREFLLGDVV